jgi:hypothetical protein
VKYDSSGTKQWTRQFGSPDPNDSDIGHDLAVDASGDVYIVGITDGDLDGYANNGHNDAFLVKYNSDGVRQWTELIGTSSYENLEGIAIDTNGYIYIAGHSGGDLDGNVNAGHADIFLVKYNPSGTRLWTKQIGTEEIDRAYDVATDVNGNVYVAGYTKGDLAANSFNNYSEMILIKYTSAGVMQWANQRATYSYDGGFARGVKVDADGNIYIIGTNIKTTQCIKYDADGTELWVEDITNNTIYEKDLAIGVDGKIFITGYTNGSFEGTTNLGNKDYFLLKYNSSGVLE